MKKIALFIFVIFCAFNLRAQDFRTRVNKYYNFSPHELTAAQQKQTIPSLDEFFDWVTKRKDIYLDSLKIELQRNDNRPYFYYDGAMLLLEISDKKEDIQLAVNSFRKTDLRDIIGEHYFRTLHKQALNGIDVTIPAIHILSFPNFQAFIPQHFLTLNSTNCLIYLLQNYDAEKYVQKLFRAYNSYTDIASRKTILIVLNSSSCCAADEFITSIINSETTNEELKTFARELRKQNPSSQKNDPEEYADIRAKISKKLKSISDESLDEIHELLRDLKEYYSCTPASK